MKTYEAMIGTSDGVVSGTRCELTVATEDGHDIVIPVTTLSTEVTDPDKLDKAPAEAVPMLRGEGWEVEGEWQVADDFLYAVVVPREVMADGPGAGSPEPDGAWAVPLAEAAGISGLAVTESPDGTVNVVNGGVKVCIGQSRDEHGNPAPGYGWTVYWLRYDIDEDGEADFWWEPERTDHAADDAAMTEVLKRYLG